MLKVMFMKVSGKMIKLMDLESILTVTVTGMLGIGKTTSNMERELRSGLMIPNMMDFTNLA